MELTAERVVAGGAALARGDDGRVVFVEGALPGERVLVEVVEERRDYAKAKLVRVLTVSPSRVAEPCPFVAIGCGGCGWQHVAPAAQIALKRAVVVEALGRTGGLVEPAVEDGPALATEGFRTTLRMAVVGGRAAFHGRASRTEVPVDHCLVAHRLLDELVHEGRFGGAREVVLRAGAATGERLAWATPAGAAVTVPPDVAVGPRTSVHEIVAGRTYRIGAGSFFQSRPDGAEAVIEVVRTLAGPLAAGEGPLVDAYGGVGLFAAALGCHRPVTLLELDRHALADARHNLADRAATIVAGEVARWRPSPAELVVADPARPGLGRAAAGVLAATGAERIVLVSCDAGSLGRDARLLGELGYRHERSVVVDLFPHTPHVEVVTAFARR